MLPAYIYYCCYFYLLITLLLSETYSFFKHEIMKFTLNKEIFIFFRLIFSSFKFSFLSKNWEWQNSRMNFKCEIWSQAKNWNVSQKKGCEKLQFSESIFAQWEREREKFWLCMCSDFATKKTNKKAKEYSWKEKVFHQCTTTQ